MITANDIVKANEVLKNVVERTPLDFDRYLSEKYGATIYIKKENIGLIEVMGLAVLPGRLKFEMRKIAEYLKDEDFEKKIAELNIRSNNAGVVKIYSLGIDRKKTENGIEDTLNLVIPPSKSIKENKEALELYKKKYHSGEAA